MNFDFILERDIIRHPEILGSMGPNLKIGRRNVSGSFDLKNAFHHIQINDESVKLTSFVTAHGQYENCLLVCVTHL